MADITPLNTTFTLGNNNMPLTSAGVIPELAPVSYKFKIPQLADYFEALSTEQSHIAIEGALNIIFGQAQPDQSGLAQEGDPSQTPEEDLLDHEELITSSVVFALYAHQLGINAGYSELQGLGMVELSPEEAYENSELYLQMEGIFKQILVKMATEINSDLYNQDVVTLHEEMTFFNRIELFSQQYDTNSEILLVTLSARI